MGFSSHPPHPFSWVGKTLISGQAQHIEGAYGAVLVAAGRRVSVRRRLCSLLLASSPRTDGPGQVSSFYLGQVMTCRFIAQGKTNLMTVPTFGYQ